MKFPEFEQELERQGKAARTIRIYSRSVFLYFSLYPELSIDHLRDYRCWLLKNYRLNTVNTRIYGINRYLDYLLKAGGLPEAFFLGSSPIAADDPVIRRSQNGIYRLCPVKEQQKSFLDNVISQRDYERMKRRLKKDGRLYWYFVVRFLAGTGARISELLQIKMEDLCLGYLDLYSKGGKVRRLFFPRALCEEAIPYFYARGVQSGFIFLNRRGALISSRAIELQLKKLAGQYRIDPATVYPHSFRHRFAKNFLRRFNDISLLADLMGHDSIETTRIYLTRSSQEQKSLLDRVVTW